MLIWLYSILVPSHRLQSNPLCGDAGRLERSTGPRRRNADHIQAVPPGKGQTQVSKRQRSWNAVLSPDTRGLCCSTGAHSQRRAFLTLQFRVQSGVAGRGSRSLSTDWSCRLSTVKEVRRAESLRHYRGKDSYYFEMAKCASDVYCKHQCSQPNQFSTHSPLNVLLKRKQAR